MRKIYKYGTGQKIPVDAVYLNTIAQTQTNTEDGLTPCWFVWHYFLVEVEE